MERRQLAQLIAGDLDAILDTTRAAYLERIPRMRELPPQVAERTIAATARVIRQFLRYYVSGTLDEDSWRLVRDATVGRAGDVFTHGEILEIVEVARQVVEAVVRPIVTTNAELSPTQRRHLAETADRFVAELAVQQERRHPQSIPERLDVVLAQLEADGADFA